jgi:hypothetical protein
MSKKHSFTFNEDGTVTFRISEIGDRSRTTWSGIFRVKGGLSPFDELLAGKDMRSLLGIEAATATDHEINLAFALSNLKYRIIDAPDFWIAKSREGYGGADLDNNIIMLVLEMAINAEVETRKRLRKEARQRLDELEKALDKADSEDPSDEDDEK